MQTGALFYFFMLGSYLSYSSTLKMEAMCSSKTSVNFYRTARRYIPEDSYHCENLKSNIRLYLSDFLCIYRKINTEPKQENAWPYFVDKTEKRSKIKLSACVGTDQILGPAPPTVLSVKVEYGLQEVQFSPTHTQICVDPFYIAERDTSVLTKGSENVLPP
jgi:hypothetical protein